jgi:hypothetical protein
MPFPKTRSELIDAGYSFSEKKTCPCGASMELWNTPNGSRVPMNPMSSDDAQAISHFATCVMAAQFRRARPSGAKATAQSPAQTPPQTQGGPDEKAPPSSATPASRPAPAKGNGQR